MEFFTLSPLILLNLVPNASIGGIGFAFPNYDAVWKTTDGVISSGKIVRGDNPVCVTFELVIEATCR